MIDRGTPRLAIHHSRVFVGDLDRSIRFYADTLGFTVVIDHQTEGSGRFVAVAAPDGSALLGLVCPPAGTPEASLVGHGDHVVFVTDDLVAICAGWRNRGVVFREFVEEASWSGSFATLFDPDGNLLAVMQQDDLTEVFHREREEQRQRAQADEQARRELQLARAFQEKLLPVAAPSLPWIQLAGRCEPARQVGGDSFDYVFGGEAGICLVTADISGKGVSAALLMATLQAVVRSRSADAENLEALIQAINQHLFENSLEAAYATLLLVWIDAITETLTYVNCGHPSGLLLNETGRCEYLESTCQPLGLFREVHPLIVPLAFGTGDTLLTCTDGLLEASDDEDREFGTERFITVARDLLDQRPEEMLQGIFAELHGFSTIPGDDVTLVIARRTAVVQL